MGHELSGGFPKRLLAIVSQTICDVTFADDADQFARWIRYHDGADAP